MAVGAPETAAPALRDTLRVDGVALAHALVERVSDHLPARIELVLVGDLIEIRALGAKYGGRTVLIDISESLAMRHDVGEALQLACEQFLSTLQDVVAEATAEPWPGTHFMPDAHVAVSRSEISLRFVHDGSDVLTLRPIPRTV